MICYQKTSDDLGLDLNLVSHENSISVTLDKLIRIDKTVHTTVKIEFYPQSFIIPCYKFYFLEDVYYQEDVGLVAVALSRGGWGTLTPMFPGAGNSEIKR